MASGDGKDCFFSFTCLMNFAFCILGLQHLQLVQLHTGWRWSCQDLWQQACLVLVMPSSLRPWKNTQCVCPAAMMIGGAGFSADGNKGASTKQQGHFTLLQLKTSNHLTIHVVHTSALHGAKWHISHQKASTDSATFLELVSVEFHLGLLFGIDTHNDAVNIHPLKFCYRCKQVMDGSILAQCQHSHYTVSTIPYEWKKHTAEECQICNPRSPQAIHVNLTPTTGRPAKNSPHKIISEIRKIAPPRLYSLEVKCPCCFMQSPIQPQQLKPAPPLVQTLLKDIMVKCERCKRDVKAGDFDTHQCSTLPTKVEVKMASRVLKRLASTSPEQTLLCTGGKMQCCPPTVCCQQ
ncbi:hypothetical protein EMCRGX_G024486 [Ephydatia muelleri]